MVNVEYWLAYAVWWLLSHWIDIIAFGIGLLWIPALSWYGPHPFIGEYLASVNAFIGNACFSLQFAGAKLYQRLDGAYEMRPLEAGTGPESHRTRFAGAAFGWDYERDPDAHEGIEELAPGEYPQPVIDQSIADEQAVATDGGQSAIPERLLSMHRVDITRGGVRTFFDPDDAPGDGSGLVVNLASVLGGYENAGGINIAITALLRSMPEYGGDTSGLSVRMQFVGFFASLVLGIGLGWVILL